MKYNNANISLYKTLIKDYNSEKWLRQSGFSRENRVSRGIHYGMD
jgi:hypothetical protein